MGRLSLAAVLFLTTTTISASPITSQQSIKRDGVALNITSETFFNGTCTPESVAVKKEWRNLTDVEKKAYIDAELCLMAAPSVTDLPGVESRYDDLQALHQYFTNTSEGDIIHNVGQFLPFHRYFMNVHAEVLKSECNYTGVLPWWDEGLDAASGNFFQSNMWDDVTGFGGNGTEADHCVRSGPFANRTMHIGPDEETTNYCFTRIWNNAVIEQAGAASVAECYANNDYESFWPCAWGGPHSAGHGGTGGVMIDVAASPGDPMFFMHHTYLDRIWWQWQQINATSRLYGMGGNTTTSEPATGWVTTTLDYVLSSYGIIPNVTIDEVMNIQGGYLCYEYEY
ncbi:related to monophenol monooxygenase (tyrosinase) [Phialocephala subalpina]|uniref:Related to monophenol monooxygenase (Tyrosinase) n=1 Tax=Phialocephala subalpina TaxID=576137 RepID=A0A1L7WHP6_9HELO|nr:related to monophenol monooxygenase (tyrosinase) [Phialocephala subalpina]